MGPKCSICRKATAGIKDKGAASKKRVSRRFGSVLCSQCLRTVIMEANRVAEKRKTVEDVSLSMRKFVAELAAG
jgi:ribosomal protein L34E